MGSPPPNDDALKGAEDPSPNAAVPSASDPPGPGLLSPATGLDDPDQGRTIEMLPVDELDDVFESALGLAVGHRVGNYRLERVVGHGSFAEVWLAVEEREHGFAKRVALKLMKAGAQASAGELEAMRAEARLCGMLHHPRLVDVYATGDIDGITYIAMEYVEGMTLHELQHQVHSAGLKMPLSVVLDIAIQLCEGLDYAHNAKDHDGEPLHLVHRDLKPGNIMVSRDGQVKIADFGLAKTTTSEQATKEGMLRGTPGFVAPEVWRGTRDFVPSVDLFAVGAILFEIATGRPLFTGEIHAVIFRVVSGDVEEDLQQLRLHRPELAPVLRGLLERDREKRMQQAWEALEPLKALRRKADDPGGLKLFLDLFLPDGKESGRLQVLPSTEDPDWHAVLGSVSLIPESGLVPLSPDVPEVPATRSMEAPVSIVKSAEKIGDGFRDKPSAQVVTPESGANSRRWLWVGLWLLTFLFLGVIGVALVGDSPSDSPATLDHDPGSSVDERGKRAIPEISELDDGGRLAAVQAVEAPPAPVEAPPAPVEAPPAQVKVIAAPAEVIAAPAEEHKPPIHEVAVAAKEAPIEEPVVKTSAAPVRARVHPVASTASKGCLVLKSNPGGLLVSLNGKEQGWSAGKRGREEEVEPGWYDVGMGANPGEVEASVKVRVRGGERVEVRCLWGAKSSCKATKLSGACGKSG